MDGEFTPHPDEEQTNYHPAGAEDGIDREPEASAEISYDDPRVRSLMDGEGLTAEEAIMQVKGEQAEEKRTTE